MYFCGQEHFLKAVLSLNVEYMMSFSILVSSLYFFLIFHSQSVNINSRDAPRLVAATWMLFSLVLLRSYVAMLIASFTLPPLSPTMNTLEELVESDFSWGLQVN